MDISSAEERISDKNEVIRATRICPTKFAPLVRYGGGGDCKSPIIMVRNVRFIDGAPLFEH